VGSGEPIPDGIRQDENDFVLVHLINRENVAGGINDIFSNEKIPLECCRLNINLDSIVL